MVIVTIFEESYAQRRRTIDANFFSPGVHYLVCSVQEIIVKLITHLYLQEIKAVCFFSPLLEAYRVKC